MMPNPQARIDPPQQIITGLSENKLSETSGAWIFMERAVNQSEPSNPQADKEPKSSPRTVICHSQERKHTNDKHPKNWK